MANTKPGTVPPEVPAQTETVEKVEKVEKTEVKPEIIERIVEVEKIVYRTPPPIVPRYKIERQGSRAEPYVRRWPQVRGGICEYCGVLDRNVPSDQQYKLCPHFRGLELRCSYCDEAKNPNDVAYHHTLNIAASPSEPDTMIVWCDAYECSRRHEERFKRNK